MPCAKTVLSRWCRGWHRYLNTLPLLEPMWYQHIRGLQSSHSMFENHYQSTNMVAISREHLWCGITCWNVIEYTAASTQRTRETILVSYTGRTRQPLWTAEMKTLLGSTSWMDLVHTNRNASTRNWGLEHPSERYPTCTLAKVGAHRSAGQNCTGMKNPSVLFDDQHVQFEVKRSFGDKRT